MILMKRGKCIVKKEKDVKIKISNPESFLLDKVLDKVKERKKFRKKNKL